VLTLEYGGSRLITPDVAIMDGTNTIRGADATADCAAPLCDEERRSGVAHKCSSARNWLPWAAHHFRLFYAALVAVLALWTAGLARYTLPHPRVNRPVFTRIPALAFNLHQILTEGNTMTTILIVVLVLFVLGGGGWGYSRFRN